VNRRLVSASVTGIEVARYIETRNRNMLFRRYAKLFCVAQRASHHAHETAVRQEICRQRRQCADIFCQSQFVGCRRCCPAKQQIFYVVPPTWHVRHGVTATYVQAHNLAAIDAYSHMACRLRAAPVWLIIRVFMSRVRLVCRREAVVHPFVFAASLRGESCGVFSNAPPERTR